MMTGLEVAPDPEPTASIFLTTSMPLVTEPKTTCLPSSQSVLTVQRKNLRVMYRRHCASLISIRDDSHHQFAFARRRDAVAARA